MMGAFNAKSLKLTSLLAKYIESRMQIRLVWNIIILKE